MNRYLTILLLAAFTLTGCGGKKTVKPETTGAVVPTATGGAPASTTSGANAGQQAGMQALDPFEDPANPLSTRIIYFEYNSAEVRDIDVVNAHARYLADTPGSRVRLEGHADERGSREYNVALSERRALSVKRLIMFQGVRPEQITTVAYGEERPVEFCHDDSCWSKNRRVEIVYESK